MSNHKRIYLSPPHLSGLEIGYIQEAIANNWVAPVGKNLDDFEILLNEYIGVQASLALNSGTAAIHLALRVLGIQQGDIVLCSALTFIATANPILYQGAKPVFIDSEFLTRNMSPEYLEQAIIDCIKNGKKPKAILLVHVYGMPAQLNEIKALADHYEIPIIEDAAEALGAEYNGRKVGSFGTLSILSFNGNKIITTSAGGALLSDNPSYIEKAKYLSQQARMPFQSHYEHQELGYNYRMSNILAGIGVGQMAVLEERVNQKRKIFETYQKELAHIQAVSFLQEPSFARSSRWIICMKIDKQSKITPERLGILLEKENIETRFLWKPLHLQPLYQSPQYLYYGEDKAEKIFSQSICMPSGTNMTDQDMDRVIEVVKKSFLFP